MKTKRAVLVVVLTGGPASGKTTLCGMLLEHFGAAVIRIFNEAATTVLQSGVHPASEPKRFQRLVTGMQVKHAAQARELDDVEIVVLDRGALDGAAYGAESLDAFCETHGLDLDTVYSWYDLVVHFESLAVAAPELYRRGVGNEHRMEDAVEVAAGLCHGVKAAWRGHPNFQSIGGSDLAFKAARLIELIEQFR